MRRRERFDPDAVEAIIEQTRRMERLLGDLRQAITASIGWVEIQPTEIDLCEVARNAADRARILSKRHPVQVVTPDTPVIGWWDQGRLDQILDNLLGNAQKYSGPGSEISITVQAGAACAHLSVTDTGAGIPPESLPYLFERFYRGTEASGASGLGLGLYIVRMLVDAHGGTVQAESEPGRGTTIHVQLPLDARLSDSEYVDQ
jgi:signal transduction histidine kinase